MKRMLTWLWLLTKRLYKKPTFLVLLALIPILVVGYSLTPREDSGMVSVALASYDDSALARAALEQLEGSQLLRTVRCQTPEEAEALVRYGKADCAWILDAHFEEAMVRFLEAPTRRNAFATVVVREDDVALRLAREKLSGALFSLFSSRVATDFVRQNVPGLAHLSDARLEEYYESVFPGTELFAFDEVGQAQQTHYLTAPVRGLLAVVVLLCALAAGLYWQEDLRRGTFGWLSRRGKDLAELGSQLLAVTNVALAALVALWLSGLTVAFGRELPAMALYGLSVACFAALLRRLCGRALAILLPLLVVATLVLCPVFFDLGALRQLQYLLPTTYYLNGLYDPLWLWGLAGYGAASLGLWWLLGMVKTTNR